MNKIENFIAGEFRAPASNQYFNNFEPATGKAYSLIADSDERDLRSAVEAAERAFPYLI